MRLAPRAMFFELDFALNFAFVFACPMIDAFALGALKFNDIVLRHKFRFCHSERGEESRPNGRNKSRIRERSFTSLKMTSSYIKF